MSPAYPQPTPAIRLPRNTAHHQQSNASYNSISPGLTLSSLSSSVPMPIPNAREAVPPPLPPPRYIRGLEHGQDAGYAWLNSRRTEAPGSLHTPSVVKPGSSLLGQSLPRRTAPGLESIYRDADRRASHPSAPFANIDHDLSSDPSREGSDDELRPGRPALSNFRLHSENDLGHRAMHTSTQAYDKSLLSKIGGPKTPTLGSAPLPGIASRSLIETSHSSAYDHNKPGQLKALSVPDSSRHFTPLDSPSSRWPNSAISPRYGYRSPLSDHRSIDTPFSSRHNSMAESLDEQSLARRSHHDQNVFLDPELMEENGMRDLDISDRNSAFNDDYSNGGKGIKRRAISPPSDDIRDSRGQASGHNSDLYHRRAGQVLAHRSPSARYPPPIGSLNSMNSSLGVKNSFASTASWNPSLASSITSHGGDRLSPSALSPAGESDYHRGPISPYPSLLNSNPHDSTHSAPGPPPSSLNQLRQPMNTHPIDGPAPRLTGLARVHGFYVCECCPKKPKKFETREELEAHITEKQYQCQYCPNRFKNKNEAERHQNSLHLRRNSWSCAALAGVHAAFHPSGNTHSNTDVCGYCGMEFVNPADWDTRAEHLCQIHKFGECNQSKKFFRADHFRQHLKHSHAGTSGKWTNMLETACMREEAPPIPLSQQRGKQAQALASQATHALSQMPHARMVDNETYTTAGSSSHDRLNVYDHINPDLDGDEEVKRQLAEDIKLRR